MADRQPELLMKLVVVLLVAAVSAASWWPVTLEPALDLPWAVPLVVIPVCCCAATVLFKDRWLRFVGIASASTLAGLLVGYVVWPLEDGIAESYAGIVAIVAALVVALVSLVACLIGRRITVPNLTARGAVWTLVFLCVAFGPVALAVRPLVIAHRVARNDRVAAERFASLKLAIERTRLEPGGSASVCDGRALKRNYSGPPFSEKDWRFIAGNYVQADGYVFGMYIDCSQPSHYAIDVLPARGKADGTRTFCTDETGRVGCKLAWNPPESECIPCQE